MSLIGSNPNSYQPQADETLSYPVKFENSKASDVHNFELLSNKKNVNSLKICDGVLSKMDRKEQVKHRLKKFAQKIGNLFNYDLKLYDPNEIKTCIDDLVSRIRLNDQIDDEKAVTSLFFDTLSRHSSEEYDPSKLDTTVTDYLKNSQRFEKDFNKAIKDVSFIDNNPPERKNQFYTAVRNSLLSLSLGAKPCSPGGFTDCFKIKSLEGKTEGIFKPVNFNDWSTAHKSLLKRIKIVTCWLTGLSGSLPYLPSSLSECSSYIVGKHMGDVDNPVKETALVKLKVRGTNYKGSFQVWENRKSKMASQYFGLGKYYEGKTKKEIPDELFDRMVILDVLTGNMDRHAENWLLIQDEKDRAIDVVTIDGGKAMSSTHSNNWLEWHNQYCWHHMKKYANRPFSDKGVEIIDQVYKNRKALLQDLHSFYHKNEKGPYSRFLISQRIDKVKDRLEVLHKYAYEGKTLRQLSHVRTNSEFSEALKTPSPKKIVAKEI